MFTNHHPSLNNHDLHDHVAQAAYNEAIDKVAELTGLNTQQSLSLLRQQFQMQQSGKSSSISSLTKPILAHNEYQFIADLFH